MSEYFIYTTSKKHSKALGNRIDKAVKAIRPDMTWVGPVSIPGNHLTGWLVRPNDGRNDHGDMRADNKRAQEIAESMLAAAK